LLDMLYGEDIIFLHKFNLLEESLSYICVGDVWIICIMSGEFSREMLSKF